MHYASALVSSLSVIHSLVLFFILFIPSFVRPFVLPDSRAVLVLAVVPGV